MSSKSLELKSLEFKFLQELAKPLKSKYINHMPFWIRPTNSGKNATKAKQN
jgi:hypothetical protein